MLSKWAFFCWNSIPARLIEHTISHPIYRLATKNVQAAWKDEEVFYWIQLSIRFNVKNGLIIKVWILSTASFSIRLKKKVESNRIKSPQVGSFIRYLFPWMPIILSEKKTREQKSRVHSVARWTEVDVPFNRSISLVLLAFSSLNLQVSNVQIKRITLTSMKRPRKEHIEWVFEPFHP